MRRSLLFITAALIALTPGLVTAQSPPAAANSERKVASRVAPGYPELAKRMHMHGVVRLEAVVRANGSVKSTRVLAEIRFWSTPPSMPSENGNLSLPKTRPPRSSNLRSTLSEGPSTPRHREGLDWVAKPRARFGET